MKPEKIIIAGPCAAESEKQIIDSLNEAEKRNLWALRISLWKPRTRPGFDGLKEKGIYLFHEAEKRGVVPATEVMNRDNVRSVLKEFPNSEIMFWIGSRNQNHFLQKEIANEVSKNKKAYLLIKNQPWESKKHWIGIIEHIKNTNMNYEKIILCHRGFFSSEKDLSSFRNVPNFEMAGEIKEETKLSMIIDPSHIGGNRPNVLRAIEETKKYNFDGVMIEVHPNPETAYTDKEQQLSWSEFDSIKL